MERTTFSPFETEASLCVWEWLINKFDEEDKILADDQKIKPLFESYGWGGMRSVAIQAGCIMVELYNYAEANGLEHMTEDSFDWEFTPMICHHLDWLLLTSDNQYGKGTWAPDPAEFLAIIVAKQALGHVAA